MLIILEGMSTAGKTMVQKALAESLLKKKIKYRIVDQNEGLPPETFEHLNSEKSINFLIKFLKETCVDKNKVIICDRLHLSHIAITNATNEEMDKIENELIKYNPLLVLLTIDKLIIRERIENAISHRGEQWVKELARRGKDRESSIKWFIGTQERLLDLFDRSKLPKVSYDTTQLNFNEIADRIVNEYIIN